MNKIIRQSVLLCALCLILQGCLTPPNRWGKEHDIRCRNLLDRAPRKSFSLPPIVIYKDALSDEFSPFFNHGAFYHDKRCWIHNIELDRVIYLGRTYFDDSIRFSCEHFTFYFGFFARNLETEEGYFRRYRDADPILSQEADYRELGDIVCVSYKFDYSAKKFSNVKALKLALVRNEIKEIPVDITDHEALKIIEDIRAYNRPRIAAYAKKKLIQQLEEAKPKQ